MKKKAIEELIRIADGFDPTDLKPDMEQLAAEARAELGAILTELAKVYDVLADKRDENNQLNTQFAAKDAALEALFQACANLPVEYMDKMEKEINAASKALKGTQG